MQLAYFANLRDITGVSKQTWSLNGGTIGKLISELCSTYGTEFRRWVLKDDGSLGELCIVLVNGHDIRELNGLATQLHPEDEISFFPPVAGG